MNKHLWVTQFNEKELYASADYPQQHLGGDGFTKWIAIKRDVNDKDLAVYILGHNHIPRFKIGLLCQGYIGFTIKPSGFLTEPCIRCTASSYQFWATNTCILARSGLMSYGNIGIFAQKIQMA